MLREKFLGRNPSNFHMDPIVKAFIISEGLIWSAWNFVTPIAAIFIVNHVTGGNIQAVTFGYSVYLITRVVSELIIGKILNRTSDRMKYNYVVLGLFFLTISYLSFAFTENLTLLYFSYFLMGLGLGISSPPKNSLFSVHLDKNKETTEWGLADAVTFIADAIAVILGGFIATVYGFQPLFIIASIISLLGTVPYLLRFEKIPDFSKKD